MEINVNGEWVTITGDGTFKTRSGWTVRVEGGTIEIGGESAVFLRSGVRVVSKGRARRGIAPSEEVMLLSEEDLRREERFRVRERRFRLEQARREDLFEREQARRERLFREDQRRREIQFREGQRRGERDFHEAEMQEELRFRENARRMLEAPEPDEEA